MLLTFLHRIRKILRDEESRLNLMIVVHRIEYTRENVVNARDS